MSEMSCQHGWFGLNILGQPLANSKIELINHGGGEIISR